MKRVAPRIEKLYALEAERRAAWKRFDDTLWSHLRRDEIQAYASIYASDPSDGDDEAVNEALARMMEKVHEELGEDPPGPEEDEEHHAFMETFLKLVLIGKGEVNLEHWPEDVPYPPDSDDLEKVRREEEVMLRVCRSEKHKGEAERQAAAWIVFHVAISRTARVYSSDKP